MIRNPFSSKPAHIQPLKSAMGNSGTLLVNAYSTLRSTPDLDFPHVMAGGWRNLSDPEMAAHLNGFQGYCLSTTKGQMTATLYGVLRHIQRVQNQVSFEVESSALDAVSDWASRANAVLFLPDGTVRDPQGRFLVSQNPANLVPAAEIPFPEDAKQRKARIDSQLAQRGIRVPATLPPVIGEGEVHLQAAADVARRAVALFAVALRAESVSGGNPIPLAEMRGRLPFLDDALSPAEQQFLQNEAPDEQTVVNFAWRYESLALLQWALGWTETLPFPDEICDVPWTARVALDHAVFSLDSATLRSSSELLDALDLHYRLHWAVRQSQVEGKPAPANLEAGVVLERHYALNWLTRFENKPWDEVDTPT